MEPRYVCVHFPFWAVDLLRRTQIKQIKQIKQSAAESPGLVLVVQDAQQLVVQSACKRSLEAGVREGMTLALASAMLPGLAHYHAQPLRAAAHLYQLAVWAFKFSPLSGLDAEVFQALNKQNAELLRPEHFGLVLDITGTQRVHGGEDALAKRIHEALLHAGFDNQLAIAPTYGAAWALSRYALGRISIIRGRRVDDALDSLPVEALRIGEECSAALHEVGIRRVGELRKLARADLPQRFGELLLTRLDTALGRAPEPLRTVQAPLYFRAARSFETPLTQHGAIVEILLQLLKEVYGRLQKKGRKAAAFLLQVESLTLDYRKVITRKEIALHAASRNFLHIRSVVAPVIEGLQIPGGVVRLAVAARDTERSSTPQEGFFAEDRFEVSSRDADEFLNMLSARLGKNSVQEVGFRESHIPERAFAYTALQRRAEAKRVQTKNTQHSPEERPAYLLPRPEEVQVIAMLPDKPPAWLKWHSRSYKIVRGLGPERISPEWWREHLAGKESQGDLATRDYFKVQDDEGRWIWIYRDAASTKWFVHGLWV